MRDYLETLEFDRLKSIIEKYIQTEYGKKTLRELKPNFDIEYARKAFAQMEEFFEFFTRWGLFTLDDVYISDILQEALSGILTEKELLKIGSFLGMVREVEEYFREQNSDIADRLLNLQVPQHLLENIYSAIDEHGLLKDTASNYLFDIRNSIRSLKEEIVRSLKSSMHSRLKEIIQDTAVFLKRSRYTVLVKPNYKEYIQGRVVDVSKSGSLFVEPESIYEKNNRLEELILKEEAERRRILSRLTQLVRKSIRELTHNERRIGYFDLQMAKYSFIKRFGEPQVEFKKRTILYAKGAKHPILAHIKSDTKSVDIDLKQQPHLIITGPNTGGKTVFLKTVGLTVASIFSGIPPIAQRVEIGPIDRIFAIIGDEQDIFESLSSFSAKIAAFKKAYEQLTASSLVLADEIGSGTSPDEGEAVAYAAIKSLSGKCLFVATTHYKRLAHILASEGYPVAAFEFDEKTLKPTYRLIYNRVGASYALEIMETLKLPKEVLEIAKEFYRHHQTDFSRLEQLLEEKLKQLEQENKKLNELKARYEEMMRKGKDEIASQQLALRRQITKQRTEYERLTRQLREQINKLMKTGNVSEAHRALNRIRTQESRLLQSNTQSEESTSFKSGDIVTFMDKKGRIAKIKGNKAWVETDGMLLEVELSRLKPSSKDEKPEKRVTVIAKKPASGLQINLIGKRRDEAQLELLRFIDSAIADAATSIRIVHGLGSGILRQMVHETLKEHPMIKSFRPAPPAEGGDGATIAELK